MIDGLSERTCTACGKKQLVNGYLLKNEVIEECAVCGKKVHRTVYKTFTVVA